VLSKIYFRSPALRFEISSLEDITMSAEVSATGRLSILGTGREIGGNGGFSFSFKKRA
jgi:hypothetical protein